MTRREQIYDEWLVLGCQEGDTEALNELLERWQERLWRHAWRLTGEEDAAWDALQDALIGIAQGINKLEDTAAFPGWAYRIVSNKCRDFIRREGRRRQTDQQYSEDAQHAMQQQTLAKAECSDMNEALNQLSGEDRAILALHYNDGFSIADIAQILDIKEGTVKSRLYYARQHLKELMEDKENE